MKLKKLPKKALFNINLLNKAQCQARKPLVVFMWRYQRDANYRLRFISW